MPWKFWKIIPPLCLSAFVCFCFNSPLLVQLSTCKLTLCSPWYSGNFPVKSIQNHLTRRIISKLERLAVLENHRALNNFAKLQLNFNVSAFLCRLLNGAFYRLESYKIYTKRIYKDLWSRNFVEPSDSAQTRLDSSWISMFGPLEKCSLKTIGPWFWPWIWQPISWTKCGPWSFKLNLD